MHKLLYGVKVTLSHWSIEYLAVSHVLCALTHTALEPSKKTEAYAAQRSIQSRMGGEQPLSQPPGELELREG